MKRAVGVVLLFGLSCGAQGDPVHRGRKDFGLALHAEVPVNVRVLLPETAGDWARVDDIRSDLWVRCRALDEEPVPVELRDGAFVYPGAAPGGGDVLQVTGRGGVEDFAFFERRPVRQRLRYEVDVRHVAGLRWVGGSVEFLDQSGSPRLRVAPPYFVNAAGQTRPARLELRGCAASRDPRPPWGRPVIAPGAPSCELEVAWSATSYPIVVDPAWTSAQLMAETRSHHAAVLLQSGRVLVSGGEDEGVDRTSAEIYDPQTDTWASTGSMSKARDSHTLTLLSDGRAIAVGGAQSGAALASTEIYDPNTGTWTDAADLVTARTNHGAAAIPAGVLVVGGESGAEYSAELFAGGTWSARMSSTHYHKDPIVALADGRVFAAGPLPEIYDPNADAWSDPSYIKNSRIGAAVAKLSDGRVVLVGDVGTYDDSADVYDPVADTWQTVTLQEPRYLAAAASLQGGGILVVGGTDITKASSSAGAETYSTASGAFATTASMTDRRYAHSATTLADGRILVSGGIAVKAFAKNTLRSAEVFSLQNQGSTCTSCADCSSKMCQGGTCIDSPAPTGEVCSCDAGCASGFCVDGVCCDQACVGSCMACASEKTGQSNGQCAPVAKNTDPDDECNPDPTSPRVCGADPVCDGAGACYCAPAGAGQCVNDHTLVVNGSAQDCSPYKCEVSGACRTSCSDSNDCVAGTVCDSGKCTSTTAPAGGDESGCGCRAAPRQSTARFWLFGLLLLLWRRRR